MLHLSKIDNFFEVDNLKTAHIVGYVQSLIGAKIRTRNDHHPYKKIPTVQCEYNSI